MNEHMTFEKYSHLLTDRTGFPFPCEIESISLSHLSGNISPAQKSCVDVQPFGGFVILKTAQN